MTRLAPVPSNSASPFRSTAAYARTRSVAPAVERATFVCFTLSGVRFAASVEVVERVLRRTDPRNAVDEIFTPLAVAAPRTVEFGGRVLPLVDVTSGVHAADARARLLVLSLPTGWIAAAVDSVEEVATVDAAGITPISAEQRAAGRTASGSPFPHGVRGSFVRGGHEVLVLDVARTFGATTR